MFIIVLVFKNGGFLYLYMGYIVYELVILIFMWFIDNYVWK